MEERWGKDNRRWVNGVPWNKYKDDEYQDGEVPEEVEVKEAGEEERAMRGDRWTTGSHASEGQNY